MDTNADAVKVLNELIEISEDGKKGFAEAADDAKDESLKAVFHDGSTQCSAAAHELINLVTSLGGKASAAGSVAGAAHRGWLKVKSAVTDANIAALEEVERGQDHAKAGYAKALKATLPANIRDVVQRQYNGVVRHHDKVRALRDHYKSAN